MSNNRQTGRRLKISQEEHDRIANVTYEGTMNAIVQYLKQRGEMPRQVDESARRCAEVQGMAKAYLMHAALALNASVGGTREQAEQLASEFMDVVLKFVDE